MAISAQIMMLAGFFLLLFFSMGFYTLVKVPSEISMLFAIVILTEFLQICGHTIGLRMGCYIFAGIAAAGLVLFLIKEKDKKSFFSIGIACLFVLFTGAVILFRGGFIQWFDDFHQWALEVKYMLENNVIPPAGGYVPIVPMESGLFNVFFQILGGYNEGNMHASSFLLTAAALVVPLAGIKWKQWPRAFVYVFLTYVGMFSIYKLPYKSLYVDLPAAAWAAVLCVWWMTTDSIQRTDGSGAAAAGKAKALSGEDRFHMAVWKKSLVALPFLLFITRIKWGIGLLLVVFTVGCIGVMVAVDQREGKSIRAFLRKSWAMILGLLAVAVTLFIVLWVMLGSKFVPASLSGVVEALTISSEKAKLTLNTLVHNLFMKSLASNPNMRLYTVQSTILIVLGLVLVGYLGRKVLQKKAYAFAIYYPFVVVAYAVALYITYVSTFTYEESIRNATGYRYLSVIILYGFFIFTGLMLHSFTKKGKEGRIQRVIVIGLCFLVLSNVNSKIIYMASEFHYWKLPQYEVIKETKDSIKKIEEVIGEEDKVYMLSNEYDLENMNEYPLCVALYYLEDRVSNYLITPWEFNKDGSLYFVTKSDININVFDQILRDGGYTYIWVHSYDNYLEDQFERLFDCRNVQEGLYKINYQEDGTIRLEKVLDLTRESKDEDEDQKDDSAKKDESLMTESEIAAEEIEAAGTESGESKTETSGTETISTEAAGTETEELQMAA